MHHEWCVRAVRIASGISRETSGRNTAARTGGTAGPRYAVEVFRAKLVHPPARMPIDPAWQPPHDQLDAFRRGGITYPRATSP
jgi:hypothetical protein